MFCEKCGQQARSAPASMCARCGAPYPVVVSTGVEGAATEDVVTSRTAAPAVWTVTESAAPRPDVWGGPTVAHSAPTSLGAAHDFRYQVTAAQGRADAAEPLTPRPGAGRSAAVPIAHGLLWGSLLIAWVVTVAVSSRAPFWNSSFLVRQSMWMPVGGAGRLFAIPLGVALLGVIAAFCVLPSLPSRRVAALGAVVGGVVILTIVTKVWYSAPGSGLLAAALAAGWLLVRLRRPQTFLALPLAAAFDLAVSYEEVVSLPGWAVYLVGTFQPVVVAALACLATVRIWPGFVAPRSRPLASPAVAYGVQPGTVPATNPLAIVAFVLSFFVAIPAVVCGHVALAQIRRSGERGRGLAVAALAIGYTALVLAAAWIAFLLALVHSA